MIVLDTHAWLFWVDENEKALSKTGNMELVLDRRLANDRLFPAISIRDSGTLREEKTFRQKNRDASKASPRVSKTLAQIGHAKAAATLQNFSQQ